MARTAHGSGGRAWVVLVVGVFAAVMVVLALAAVRGGAALREARLAVNLPSAGSLRPGPAPAPPTPTPPRS